MKTRRERYRELLARLGAPVRVKGPIDEGLYVPPPESTGRAISRRMEIQPDSAHVLVGGIGSGKSTELLVATDHINALPDVRAVYVDVAERQALDGMRPGVLMALAALTVDELLGDRKSPDATKAAQRLRVEAIGYYADGRDWEDGVEWIPGVLTPPSSFSREVSELRDTAQLLLNEFARSVTHLVVLYDSLDRLPSTAEFAPLVTQDVAALRSLGIGVVLVGPMALLYGTYRDLGAAFDRVHYQPTFDVEGDPEARSFVRAVLDRRAGKDSVTEGAARRLVELSGGILRDLVSLARGAAEEAYVGGKDVIDVEHAEKAADGLGRRMVLGLGTSEVEVLRRLETNGSYVAVSDQDVGLLATGHVIRRGVGYAIHPLIRPLLAQLATPAPS